MSAKSLIEQIVTNLQNDAILLAWCVATWGKSPTVKVTYRNRAEIGADELPLILITSPANSRDRNYGSLNQERTVRLYAGFYQPDKELGALELADFEEQVCAALERYRKLGSHGTLKDPLASTNDEGAYQPNYFFAGEFTVNVTQ